MKKIAFIMALTGTLVACTGGGKPADGNLIEKQTLALEDGHMTPEALWAFGRLSGLQVSPDGKDVLYSVQYYDIAQNRATETCIPCRWLAVKQNASPVQP